MRLAPSHRGYTPFYLVVTMTRLTLFLSLSAFIVVMYFSAPVAPAQGHGLVQDDYDQYAQYFKKGREPNFTTSESWRRKYADHRWAEFADGDEYRDSMLAAEVLTGIYLTQHVDHRLTYQIENIILGKAAMSNVLAERVTLDAIAEYMQKDEAIREKLASTRATAAGGSSSSSSSSDLAGGPMGALGGGTSGSSRAGGLGGLSSTGSSSTGGSSSGSSSSGSGSRAFYSDLELERMYALNRNIDEVARRKIVSGPLITRGQRIEIRSIQNLFDHSEKGWVPTYYFMREKFLVLNELADSFTFNWDEERREAELAKMMEDPKIRKEAETKANTAKAAQATAVRSMMSGGMGSSSSSSPMIGLGGRLGGLGGPGGDVAGGDIAGMAAMAAPFLEEPSEEEIESACRDLAEEKMKTKERRELAYKYIVGVYESSDFYLSELRKIRRYFESGASQGDSIAQFHLALFLRYLGEFVDPDMDESTRISNSDSWLSKVAETSDEMKKRIEILYEQIAAEDEKAGKRAIDRTQKLLALVKVEKDKLDLFDTVLLSVLANIKSSGSGTSGGSRSGGGGYGGGRSGGMGGRSGGGYGGGRSGGY